MPAYSPRSAAGRPGSRSYQRASTSRAPGRTLGPMPEGTVNAGLQTISNILSGTPEVVTPPPQASPAGNAAANILAGGSPGGSNFFSSGNPQLGTVFRHRSGNIQLPTVQELTQKFGPDVASGVLRLMQQGTSPLHIRELDPWTKMKHFEYEIPGGQQPDQPNLTRIPMGDDLRPDFTGAPGGITGPGSYLEDFYNRPGATPGMSPTPGGVQPAALVTQTPSGGGQASPGLPYGNDGLFAEGGFGGFNPYGFGGGSFNPFMGMGGFGGFGGFGGNPFGGFQNPLMGGGGNMGGIAGMLNNVNMLRNMYAPFARRPMFGGFANNALYYPRFF